MAPESPNTPAGVQRREARQDRERIQGKNYLEKGRTCLAIHLRRLDFMGEMREPTRRLVELRHLSLRREANAPAPTGAFSFP